MKKPYSFGKGLGKAVVATILFGLPILAQILPTDFLNLTIGGLLVLVLNWAKVKYNSV